MGDKTKIKNRHQEGTVQGNAAGGPKKSFRHWNNNKHLGRMVGQKVFLAKHRFWKPPSYYVSHEEVLAIKRCCEKEVNKGVEWINHNSKKSVAATSHKFFKDPHYAYSAKATCAEVKGETAAQIKERLAELAPTITNKHVVDWLSANNCGSATYGTQKNNQGKKGYNYNTDGSNSAQFRGGASTHGTNYNVNDMHHTIGGTKRASDRSSETVAGSL